MAGRPQRRLGSASGGSAHRTAALRAAPGRWPHQRGGDLCIPGPRAGPVLADSGMERRDSHLSGRGDRPRNASERGSGTHTGRRSGAGQRRTASRGIDRGRTAFRPPGFGAAAQQAGFQPVAAAGGRHPDGRERRGELHPAVHGERAARRGHGLRDGWSRHDGPRNGRGHVLQLQRGRHPGDQFELGRAAGVDRPWRRGIHGSHHQERNERPARQRVRVRAERGLRRAQLLRPAVRGAAGAHSAVQPERVRVHQRRAGPSQSHLLVRPVPGFPPGAGNDAGAAGSDRAGAPGVGQHGLSGRRADRAGGPADRSGFGAVSAAQRPFRPLRRPDLCHLIEDPHAHRSVLDAHRPSHLGQGAALLPVQFE